MLKLKRFDKEMKSDYENFYDKITSNFYNH